MRKIAPLLPTLPALAPTQDDIYRRAVGQVTGAQGRRGHQDRVREHTYDTGASDSKTSARKKALKELKRRALVRIGVNVRSHPKPMKGAIMRTQKLNTLLLATLPLLLVGCGSGGGGGGGTNTDSPVGLWDGNFSGETTNSDMLLVAENGNILAIGYNSSDSTRYAFRGNYNTDGGTVNSTSNVYNSALSSNLDPIVGQLTLSGEAKSGESFSGDFEITMDSGESEAGNFSMEPVKTSYDEAKPSYISSTWETENEGSFSTDYDDLVSFNVKNNGEISGSGFQYNCSFDGNFTIPNNKKVFKLEMNSNCPDTAADEIWSGYAFIQEDSEGNRSLVILKFVEEEPELEEPGTTQGIYRLYEAS